MGLNFGVNIALVIGQSFIITGFISGYLIDKSYAIRG
jgi:hypothetical protein